MAHHRRGLRRLLSDDALLEAIERDATGAPVGEKRAALIEYVTKLSSSPPEVTREDFERLRAVGYEDADVLGICEAAAYYAYANRIVEGLGVELEPWFRDE